MSIHGKNTKPRFKITRSTQGQYKLRSFSQNVLLKLDTTNNKSRYSK